MSDNYKPTVEVVRRSSSFDDVWRKNDGRYPDAERARLVRGVPMVGDRVEVALSGVDGEVEEIRVGVLVRASDGDAKLFWAEDLRPATQNTEVEAMLSAFVEARAHKMPDRDIVKSVRDALDRVRGRDG